MPEAINLVKDAHLLSGKERARLVIKDAHQKAFIDQKGFLTESEVTALRRMTDYKINEDFNIYVEMYHKTPVIMGAITEAYLRFKYHYESLKKAHLLLNLSPAIEYLSQIIEETIADQKKKAEALKIAEMIQALNIDPKGDITLKDSLRYIKDIVPMAYEQACYFISMKQIVDRVNEELAFNVFVGKRYNEAYQNYINEVRLCIAEHNDIIKKIEGLKDIKDYIIPEPTYNTPTYEEWAKILFKEKSKDV